MTDKQEDRVYDAQIKWMEKKFGKKVQANLGWAVTDEEISTKVYGHGVLTSWIEKGKVKHDFQPF